MAVVIIVLPVMRVRVCLAGRVGLCIDAAVHRVLLVSIPIHHTSRVSFFGRNEIHLIVFIVVSAVSVLYMRFSVYMRVLVCIAGWAGGCGKSLRECVTSAYVC